MSPFMAPIYSQAIPQLDSNVCYVFYTKPKPVTKLIKTYNHLSIGKLKNNANSTRTSSQNRRIYK